MLEAVKRALGIRSNAYDGELETLILSAKADLGLAGIRAADDADPLIITAVVCYCQANRGTDTDKRLAYQEMYQAKKRDLWMAREYMAVAP